MTPITENHEFFLGGHDLEMLAIRDLLETEACMLHDKDLAWGAKASDYLEEIAACLRFGKVPVLVELTLDLDLPPGSAIRIDHHHPLPAEPVALRQIFELLGLPAARWTRKMELIAANDHGHIAALLAAGADREEIRKIRKADRAAQGVTPEDEEAALQAISALQPLAGGRLHVARLSTKCCSPLTDFLNPVLGGAGFINLLAVCLGEINFFGEIRWVESLDKAFPGGWAGGVGSSVAFWGHYATSFVHPEMVIGHLTTAITAAPPDTVARRPRKNGGQPG